MGTNSKRQAFAESFNHPDAMTDQSWHSLDQAKDQLTLRVFLLLNAISAVISWPWSITVYTVTNTTLLLVFVTSLALITWQYFIEKLPINTNVAALLLGTLWAAHIFVKDSFTHDDEVSKQATSLIEVLFVGTISFSTKIDGFLLHSTPAIITVLWLSSIEHRLRMLYFIALPSIGITFQHIIQRRNDLITNRLMSKLVEEKETLSSLSMIDPLTGLYNRRGFDICRQKIESRGIGNHYMLLIDIDNFKLFNDHYGHVKGDKALMDVAAAIRDAVRSRDVVSRHGGEEFLVMLTDIDCERAMQASERIRQRVCDLKIDHRFNNGVAPNVTVSIGITQFSSGKIEEALSGADKALYQAKHRGRNMSIMANDIVNNCFKLCIHTK